MPTTVVVSFTYTYLIYIIHSLSYYNVIIGSYIETNILYKFSKASKVNWLYNAVIMQNMSFLIM